MSSKTFSIREALGFGFRSLVKHWYLFLCIFFCELCVWLIFFGPCGVYDALLDHKLILRNPIYSFLFFLSLPGFIALTFGLKKVALELYSDDRSSPRSLFSSIHMIPHWIMAWTLYIVVCFFATCAVIIPGLIVMVRFAFFPFLIIDQNLNAVDALKTSYKLTRGYFWKIFAFWCVMTILFSAGSLFVFPVITLAWAFVYKKLMEITQRNQAVVVSHELQK
jgi:uncharacterized membrane protein